MTLVDCLLQALLTTQTIIDILFRELLPDKTIAIVLSLMEENKKEITITTVEDHQPIEKRFDK